MNIDLHCHAKISKKSPFNLKRMIRLQKTALRNGLHAIAITEHFNTAGFDDVYDALERGYRYREDHYDMDGLKVFCGMEVDVREGGHVLVIGKRDDVLQLHRELIGRPKGEGFCPLPELLEKTARRQMIRIGAHPFRTALSLGRLDDRELRGLDFLEWNGKDYNKKEPVYALAKRLGLPVVAGSDTHQWLQVGCVRNLLDQDCNTIGELKACLQSGRYRTENAPMIRLQLKSAGMVKKILKRCKLA